MTCPKPLLGALLLLPLLPAPVASADPCALTPCVAGTVVGISDGDTLTLLVNDAGQRAQKRVRLTEIDTPERAQPWGARARQALADKVFRRDVRVAATGEDRYGRVLGRIYLGERDVNRELVREGHAWVYRRYSSDIWLLDDERRAREAQLGLWSLPRAQQVPPWEWRRGRRQPATAVAAATPSAASRAFACGLKNTCREMASCAEARFHLERCGIAALDGDGDGMPCERLCRSQP